VIARIRKSKAGVAAGANLAETVHDRKGPGPRSLVHRAVDTDLRQVERRRLQRQRHVHVGVALVDGEAEIDARGHARAETGDAANGLALVADEVALRIGSDRHAVALEPGAVARILRARGRAAAAGIGAERPVEPVRCLVAEPLQEVRAEIERAVADRAIVGDRRRGR